MRRHKKIPLSRGLYAIVDAEDFDELMKFSWCAVPSSKSGGIFYAKRSSYNPKKTISMHRYILGLDKPTPPIDHINGNGLDNRKLSLRTTPPGYNRQNAFKYRGASKFKGVYRKKEKWASSVTMDGKLNYLGVFDTELAAAKAYNAAAKKLNPSFFRLNERCHTCGYKIRQEVSKEKK